MSSKPRQTHGEPPRKRPKIDAPQKSELFTTPDGLRKIWQHGSQEELVETLVAFRNKITVRPSEAPISPQDERFTFLQEWLDSSAGAKEIFDIWSGATSRQLPLLSAVISSLASIVSLLSTHYTFHTLGQPIIKNVLSSPWIQHLNGYLSSPHNDLVLATLKLFNAISAFAGGREQKSLMDVFAWESKTLPKLLTMRRRTKNDRQADALTMPDIRTLYILLMLSFADSTSSPAVKLALLEQHRDAFASIFRGLPTDPYPVVRKVLEVCWSGIWSDARVKRTVKIGIFNETCLAHIVKLYGRSEPENASDDEIPADLAHHFLLAIGSRPHVGVCFRDRGWYLRESDNEARSTPSETDEAVSRGGRVHNRILGNLLKGLKVNDDARQQELAIKILASCPELVAGYWPAAALTLEPRLSSKWIANMAFFGTVISLPVPEWSFYMPNSSLYQPTPPPLASFLENILPSVNIKAHLSRGLQSSSPLVQHCTALALVKCLEKYARVLEVMRKVEVALEEDAESGQWGRRRRDLEREIRRRVPEFSVIVALSQQHRSGDSVAPKKGPPNETQIALLAESSTRLLWLYHSCLPALVEETRFDVGKLVQNLVDENGSHEQSIAGLYTLKKLHILRLLRESDQFIWSGKTGNHTHFYIFCAQYAKTHVPAIRAAIESLLYRVLSTSILFQHDPDEIFAWLGSLPIPARHPGAESPDGAPLGDERAAVITFLDDCLQRCLKTPYRYLDELEALSTEVDTTTEGHALSPLIVTVQEQLRAKLNAKLLSASDILALVSFTRRLLLKLAEKLPDLRLLKRIVLNVCGIPVPDRLPQEYPVIIAAVKYELETIRGNIERLRDVTLQSSLPDGENPSVHEFLDSIENLPPPQTLEEAVKGASELVDWLRLVSRPLATSSVLRLAQVIERLHRPAVGQLWQYFSPQDSPLQSEVFVASLAELQDTVPFECWLLHSTPSSLASPVRRQVIAKSALLPSLTRSVSSAIDLVRHRLSSSSARKDLLLLIADIIAIVSGQVTAEQTFHLKERLLNSDAVRSVCSTSSDEDVLQGLEVLLNTCFEGQSPSELALVSTIAGSWAAVAHNGLDVANFCAVRIWAPYMAAEDIFSLLNLIISIPAEQAGEDVGTLLETLVKSLERPLARADGLAQVDSRLRDLVEVYARAPHLRGIERLVSIALEAHLPLGLDGNAPEFVDQEMRGLVSSAISHWRRRNQPRDWSSMGSIFVSQEDWTDDTASIVTKMAYIHPASREALSMFLDSSSSSRLEASHLAQCIQACLDSRASISNAPSLSSDMWLQHFTRVLDYTLSTERLLVNRTCLRSALLLIFQHLTEHRNKLITLLHERVLSLSRRNSPTQTALLARALLLLDTGDIDAVCSSVLDHGLKWAAHSFAGVGELDELAVHALGRLSRKTVARPHLLDPVMSAVVQNRLSDIIALNFLQKLLPQSQMKPVLVNRHLQSIIQHPDFYKFADLASSARGSLIHLIHTIFHLHPANTCQPSHITPLTAIYSGSQSRSDIQLLDIFHLYETSRKASVTPFLLHWSEFNADPITPIQALLNLDANQVFRTCLTFHIRRKDMVSPEDVQGSLIASQHLYDPLFAMSLCAQVLADGGPSSDQDWAGMFRTNIVSLLIRGLSAEDEVIRRLAIGQLSVLFVRLEKQEPGFQERPHAHFVLRLLKNACKYPDEANRPERISSFTTLFLAHALRAVFYPANFIYPLTARFLLQRPELDAVDVPMLYSMLYSASDDWKKERGWMLKFLADAMLDAGSAEWSVFKRRRTWDLLASLWHSGSSDRLLRTGILEVLLNLSCGRHIVTSLVLKSSLLAWMEIVLLSPQAGLQILWLKIMENLLMVADVAKLDAATNKEWRASFARCLGSLLEHSGNPPSRSFMLLESQVLLRLAQLPGPPVPTFTSLLSQCVARLEVVEQSLHPTPVSQVVPEIRDSKLHTSYTAHGEPRESDTEKWGQSVVTLWRASMIHDTEDFLWEDMTARVLLWRGMTGDRPCAEGEWLRREAISNLMHVAL